MNEFPVEKLNILTTRNALAIVIGCSNRSIFNYQKIAVEFVDDFLFDFPQLEGKFVTDYPLTTYQCWVIYRIHYFLKLVPKAGILKHSLEHDENTQHQYSKTQFNTLYPEVEINEIEGICRV